VLQSSRVSRKKAIKKKAGSTRKEMNLTCSPSAHPPQNCTTSIDNFSSSGMHMNQCCAPPWRKQCVEYLPSILLPAAASFSIFWMLSDVSSSPGWMTPFTPLQGRQSLHLPWDIQGGHTPPTLSMSKARRTRRRKSDLVVGISGSD